MMYDSHFLLHSFIIFADAHYLLRYIVLHFAGWMCIIKKQFNEENSKINLSFKIFRKIKL